MRIAHWLETLCALGGVSRRVRPVRQRRRATSPQVERLEERVVPATWFGDIPNGTVWPTGEVQRITNDVRIPLGSTLTIQPGAVIKFNNNADIDFFVDGTLLAQGTAAQPIVFTELRDDTGGDTNGDGTASGPGRQNWGGLHFQPGSTGSTMDYVELRYGGWRADAQLVVNGGELTFDHGVIRDANFYGVRIANSSPTLTNISFIGSGFAAVSMDLNSTPVISGVTMTNNTWNGLWLDAGTLPGNAVWDNPDIVYILPDDVTVPQGKTLTIGAGQVIKTGFRTELYVNGTLLANGTADDPVIFANPADDTAGGDTNNNGTNNNASNDASAGIVFSNTSTGSVLDHVEVRYSGFDVGAAIVVNGASITLTNSVIRNAIAAGISINSGTAVITGTTFQNGAGEAINATLTSSVTSSGNTFSNNAINGLLMRGGSLAADTTWNNPDTVYVLQDDVTIPQGKTLTLGAGQVIKSGFRKELFVNGTLLANGTADGPVIFANPSDDTAGGDTNNNGAANNASNDMSGGIVFSTTSRGSVLNHVEVRNFNSDANGAIQVNGASITLNNSVIRDSAHAGIWMTAGTMSISNTDFQRNAWLAIAADPASNVMSGGGNTFSQNPVNGLVMLSGTVPANATWSNPDITYAFDGNGAGVTIPVGVTLTIGPGQIIKVGNGREAFMVNGTLKALGTVGAPVICTSFDDDSVGGDTNNNGAASGPGPGNWRSWSFMETSANNVLDYVELRYGNDGAGGARPGMLNVIGSDLTVSNSVFTRSASVAIGARGDSELTLINNLIVNNVSSAGVLGSAGSQVVAINNTIDGNNWGVVVDGVGAIADLTNNLITNNARAGVVRSNQAVLNAQFNDVFNPTSVDGNYVGVANLTGVNGNLSANPLYVNRAGLDFHLLAGSPAIDAGTSEGAPVDDRDFNFRTDNPAVNNTGAGSPPFYDLGAYESAGPPRAVKSTPSGDVAGMVSEVLLTFREAMDRTSFSPAADVISFTGPTGPLAVTGFQWINKYQLVVKFNTLAKAGPYELVFGPGILNANSQMLDSDGDGTRGEGVQDRYAATWTLTPPRVESHAPVDYVPLTADHVSFTFDREMDQQSFSLSDIVSFAGPNGAIPITGFTWTDPRTLRVTFDTQTTLGYYEMALGSNIASLGGDLLDQNGNHVGGEASDSYSAGFTLAQIFHVSGNISQSATWAGLVIVDANVTILSGITLTIAPGTIVKLQDQTSITVASGGTLLSNGTVAQPVIITSLHDDSVGGDTDANGSRRGPQAGDWISIQLNGGTAQLESTHIKYGGGSATGVWNNSGMIKTGGSANLTISRSVVSDALFDGVLVQGGFATITNTIVTGTDRGIDSGFSSANVQVINSTIVDNRIGLIGHSGVLNVVNSIVSHNLQVGIDNDISPAPTVSYTDIFNPGATNTRGFTNPIGSNGNISVDPQFVNPESGNYRLDFGSPAIDAANGGPAPTTDHGGAPRYDDPRTTNTGTIPGNNGYADMGAFEFVEGAPSDLDLIVTGVSSPISAIAGDTVTVIWTEKNVGSAVAAGAWHDAVYLSTDTIWTPDDILLGDALHTGELGPHQTYAGSAEVTLPGVLPATYYFIVRANSDNALFEGSNLSNNSTASSATELDLPTLGIGTTPLSDELVATGDARVYQLIVPAGVNVRVALDGAEGNANELYLKRGEVPTRQSFDARGIALGLPDQVASVGDDLGGTYYVRVYAADISAPQSFTITATNPGFSIDSVSPVSGSNTGKLTIAIQGTDFDINSQPRVIDSANQTILPSEVFFSNTGLITATFDLTGKAVGLADVQVVNTGNVVATKVDAFSIIAGTQGRLITSITAPDRVRVGRDFTAYITYTNVGDTDLVAPIFRIISNGKSGLNLRPTGSRTQTVIELIGINPIGPAGILPPGATAIIPIYGKTLAAGTDTLVVETVQFPSTPIDYPAIKPVMRPSELSDAEWDALFNQLQLQIGPTWNDYVRTLSRDATLMTAASGLNYSVAEVFQFEVEKAREALSTFVSGRLFLRDNQHPLPGATVVLINQATGETITSATLSDGTFRLAEILPGTYDISVDGYLTTSVQAITVSAADVSNVNVTVVPSGAISGKVVAAVDGAPLPDVVVTAFGADGTFFVTTTASDGTYSINVPPGTYSVQAGEGLYVGQTVENLVVDPEEQLQNVTLALQTAGRISGKVSGPGGPVAGATVTVYGPDGVPVGSGAVTSATGDYVIAGIPVGQFTVQASADGLAPARLTNVAVGAGAILSNQNLTLGAAGSASGLLHALTGGAPVVAAIVTASTGGVAVAVTNSDEDGAFTLPDLAPGNYAFTVFLPGFASTTVNGTVNANQQTNLGTINLQTTGSVVGTVNDTGFMPLAGLRVVLWTDGAPVGESFTDENGNFSISDLAFGTYRVTVGSEGQSVIDSTSVTLSTGAPAAVLSFSVPIVGSIAGTVFDSDGVTPVPNAAVTLRVGTTELTSARTDEEGRYQFYVAAAGTYNLQAAASGKAFTPQSNLVITAGTNLANINVLAGTAIVKGTIRDAATNQPVLGGFLHVTGAGINGVQVVMADVGGNYQFSGPAGGQFQLVAFAGSLSYSMASVTLVGGTPATRDFSLIAGGGLTGIVTDAVSGQPVFGATVFAHNEAGPDGGFITYTDEHGRYELFGLQPGTYDVTVLDTDYRTFLLTNRTLVMGSTPQNFSLAAKNISVSGVVRDASARPLPGATVRATDAQGNTVAFADTDEDGTYVLTQLPPGTFILTAGANGSAEVSLPAVTVAGGSTVSGKDFALNPIAASVELDAQVVQSFASFAMFQVASVAEDDRSFVDRLFHRHPPSRLPNEAFLPTLAPGEHCVSVIVAHRELAGRIHARDTLFDAWRENYEAGKDLKAANAALITLQGLKLIGDLAKAYLSFQKVFVEITQAGKLAIGPSQVFLQDFLFPRIDQMNNLLVTGKDQVEKLMDALGSGQLSLPSASTLLDTVNVGARLVGDILNALVDPNNLKLFGQLSDRVGLITDVLGTIKDAWDLGQFVADALKDSDTMAGNTDLAKNLYLRASLEARLARERFQWELKHCDRKTDPVVKTPGEVPLPGWAGGPGSGGSSTSLNGVQSVDPNHKTGPAGYDNPATTGVNDGYMQPALMPYLVQFENSAAAGATVPAQEVVITDTLDEDLDLSTLQFTGFGFGPKQFDVPAGLSNYETIIDLRPDGINLLVPVGLQFNSETRVLTAFFRSLDPQTGLPPDDPDAGFLPVNNAAHDGEGYFTYTIQTKADLPTGTVIENFASIVFDVNAPILTPTTHNILDIGGPNSSVTALAAQSPAEFTVNWSGADDLGGSGIGTYDVYVSVDGGDYEIWQSGVVTTSAVYSGQSGKTYRFYSIAYDNVGHAELAPLIADATTTVADAPPAIENQSFNIAENSAPNTAVGLVVASGSSALTYSITNGNTGNTFTIDSTTGSIKVAAGASLNYEGTTTTYPLTVQVTDSGSPAKSSSATITIQVTDANEAPTVPSGQTFNVAATATGGTVIGTVTSNDPDLTSPNNALTFSFAGGNGTGAFAINPTTGQISVGNSVALAGLSGQLVSLDITATDGGTPSQSATQSVSVQVSNLNSAPVLANPGPAPEFIGKAKTPVKVFSTLTVTDPDGPATLGTIVISLPLGAAKKNPDLVTLPGLAAIGARADTVVNGRLQITITVQEGATNAGVQTMLQGLTFSTKGKGLKVLSRNFQVQVTDRSGALSNTITQTIAVRKK